MSKDRILKRRIPSEKQIAASRANGAKSKGPVTETGKKNSFRNLAQEIRRVSSDVAAAFVRPDEPREVFYEICDEFLKVFNPRNAVEEMLVGRLAAAHWRQLRYWREDLNNQSYGPTSQMLAEELRIDRMFFRTLQFLLRVCSGPDLKNMPDEPPTEQNPGDLAPEPSEMEPEQTPPTATPAPPTHPMAARRRPVLFDITRSRPVRRPAATEIAPPEPEIRYKTALSGVA